MEKKDQGLPQKNFSDNVEETYERMNVDYVPHDDVSESLHYHRYLHDLKIQYFPHHGFDVDRFRTYGYLTTAYLVRAHS